MSYSSGGGETVASTAEGSGDYVESVDASYLGGVSADVGDDFSD